MSTSITWNDLVTKIKGVANRGALNWSGSNTTYTVSAGYYTGGTLDSRTSYNNGYSAGRTQGRNDVKNSPGSYSLYTKSQYDTNYNNGYNKGVSAGKSSARVVSGSVQATTNENVNYTGSTHSKRVVIINNIGGTPLAIFCRITNRGENTVRFGNTMFISQTYQVTSSHAWSSSSIHIPTNTTSTQTWSYWAVIV